MHIRCFVEYEMRSAFETLSYAFHQKNRLRSKVLLKKTADLLFADDLHYHGSVARINIGFNEKQRLPRSELHAPINHRQRLVGWQKHGTQVRVRIGGMMITSALRNHLL